MKVSAINFAPSDPIKFPAYTETDEKNALCCGEQHSVENSTFKVKSLELLRPIWMNERLTYVSSPLNVKTVIWGRNSQLALDVCAMTCT